MAAAIQRAGTILAIVTMVLVMVVCVILGARLVAGPDEPTESIERAQEGPVCLSEIREEAVEQRNQNQRVWRIVRQIQVTNPDAQQVETEEVVSQVVEVGNGVCYRDEANAWQVSEPRWVATPEGFAVEKTGYGLKIGSMLGSWLEYRVSQTPMVLKPCQVIAYDGKTVQTLGFRNDRSKGTIDPEDPTCLVFSDAFGKGIDLVLQAGPGGYHQNVIFRDTMAFLPSMDRARTEVMVYTELGLEAYQSDEKGLIRIQGKEALPLSDLVETDLSAGDIRLTQGLETEGHVFTESAVFDSAAVGPGKQDIAQKQLLKDAQGRIYLVERLSGGFFEDASYPVVWDYQTVNGTLTTDTVWYANNTYYVSDNLTVSNCRLQIEPGTFVKFNSSTKLSVSGTGKIIARGKPQMNIVFTSKNDNLNGETITGSSGSPARANYTGIELGDNSEFEFCTVLYASTSVKAIGLPAIPIQHNYFHKFYNAVNVSSTALATNETLVIFNNLIIADPCDTGTPDPCEVGINITGGTAGHVKLLNNTIRRVGYGISISSSTTQLVTIQNNILCYGNYGIYAQSGYNSSNFTADHNGYYYNRTSHFSVPNKSLGSDSPIATAHPFYSSGYLSVSYLNNTSGAGNAFQNAGSCSVTSAGYSDPNDGSDPNDWSIHSLSMNYSDHVYSTSSATISQNTTWEPEYGTCDTETVDLGYHHPRVDYILYECSITVNGGSQKATLTVKPGTVIAHKVNTSSGAGKLLIDGDSGANDEADALVCIGDPGVGYVTWVEYGRAGKSAIIGIPGNTSTFIELQATSQYDICFTKFWGLGWAILCKEGNGIFRDNQCLLNTRAITFEGATGYACENCLFVGHSNAIAHTMGSGGTVRNCTFDNNKRGFLAGSSTASSMTFYDCLFTNNSEYVARINDQTISYTEYHNLYFGNASTIYLLYKPSGEQYPDLDDSDFANPAQADANDPGPISPYDPNLTDFAERFRLDPNSLAVDHGSINGGMPGYTTLLSGIADSNIIDIGYHYPLLIDTDQDGLRDYREYWLGTDPNNPDCDSDGLMDGVEVDSYGTDPLDWDSDDDDLPDGWEVDNNLDPMDTTGDNGSGGDPDNDGFTNLVEYVHGSNPQDPQSIPVSTLIQVPSRGLETIQEAINAGITGDMIEVAPGEYSENIVIHDIGITLMSSAMDYGYWPVIQETIIQAEDVDEAVVSITGNENNSFLFGFTLSGGLHGVYIDTPGDPIIASCLIQDNSADGIHLTSSTALIKNNKIGENGDDGIESSSSQVLTIRNNWIYDNADDGISFTDYSSETLVRNNTVVDNGQDGIAADDPEGPVIVNCILWGNSGDDLNNCAATYSCIEDVDTGQGNIAADPLLHDPAEHNYHLDPNSPCWDSGDPTGEYDSEKDIDGWPRLQGNRVDMGGSEYGGSGYSSLPYMTSFEPAQGFIFDRSLHSQKGWQVDQGTAHILLGNPIEVQIDPSSSILKGFTSGGENDRYIRFRLCPGKGTEILIQYESETIAAVKFADDHSIQILQNGVYADTGHDWADNTYHGIKLYINYDTKHYDLFQGSTLIADANYVGNYPTLTQITVQTGSETAYLDRMSVSDEPTSGGTLSGDIAITVPCACNNETLEGRVPVEGKFWWDKLSYYQIVYCPVEIVEDAEEEWTVYLSHPENWFSTDYGGNVVGEDGLLGYWNTDLLPNGSYYLGIVAYDDTYQINTQCPMIVMTNLKVIDEYGESVLEEFPSVFSVVGSNKGNTFVHEEQPDISVPWPGQFPFEFKRFYDSSRFLYDKPLYYGWTHNNNVTLVEDTVSSWQTMDSGFQGVSESLYGLPAYDENQVAFGPVSVTYPNGGKKIFVHKATVNGEPQPIYEPYLEDGSGEYIQRTTSVGGDLEDDYVLTGVQYQLFQRDGTIWTFNTGSIQVECSAGIYGGYDYGGRFGRLTVPISVMADRFDNRLKFNWSSTPIRLEIVDASNNRVSGTPMMEIDSTDGYLTEVRLVTNPSDPNNPSSYQVLRRVRFDMDYYIENPGTFNQRIYPIFQVKKSGAAVNNSGNFNPLNSQDQTSSYFYSGRFMYIIAYDENYFTNAALDVGYWENGRLWRRTNFVDSGYFWESGNRSSSIFEYSLENPNPEDPTVSHLITTTLMPYPWTLEPAEWPKWDPPLFLRTITTTQDQRGNLISQRTVTLDNSPVVDANSVFAENDSTPYKPEEVIEYFDGFERRTTYSYDGNGDPNAQKTYTDATHYTAQELEYHSDYPFPIRQTSWQGLNKQGKKIETLYVYGDPNGVVDTHGHYLIQEQKLLDDMGTSSELDDVWGTTSYTYYINGRVKTVTDPNGFVSAYSYDALGNPMQVWAGTANMNEIPTQRSYYDSAGQAVLSATVLGGVTFNQYDGWGRIYRTFTYEDPSAMTIPYSQFLPSRYFDPNSVVETGGQSDPNMQSVEDFGPFTPLTVTFFGYDVRNNRTFVKQPSGGTTRTTYTTSGLPKEVLYDNDSFVMSFYDDWGRKFADGYYDAIGDLYWDIWYGYDGMDRLVARCDLDYRPDPDYFSTNSLRSGFTTYYGSGQKHFEVVWGSGYEYETAAEYEYNILGQLVERIDDPNEGGLQLSTEYGYDAAGNRVWVKDPKGNYTHFGFDNANRSVSESFTVTSATPPANPRSETLYYPNGKTAATIAYGYSSELLARSDFLYDARGRLTQVTERIDDGQDPNTAVTEYGYSDVGFSVDGQLYHIRITDGEDKLSYIALDAFGNRTKTLYPSGDYEEYQYNGDGTVAARAVWDASNDKQWIEYSYDPYGRVNRVEYPDGDPNGYVEYAYDGFGRRMQVTDARNTDDRIGGTGTITWEHDALGRVSKVIDQDNWQVVYTWRADGQRSGILAIDPNDQKTRYHVVYLYDKAGRLEYVAEPLRGITTPWVAKLAYDDNGNRSALTYYLAGTFSNPVVMDYTYNADNRLTDYSTTGGPTFTLSGTTVDGLGRLRAGTETLTLVGGGTRQHALSYSYDMRSQLRTASVSNINGTTWTAGYAYDKAGNVTQQTVGGVNTNFGYDGDLMTDKGANSLDWDADGRMISGLSRSLTYNWDNKLRSATSGGTTVALRYDPDGNRVLRTVTTGATTNRKYIVDTVAELPTILLEIDPAVQDPNDAVVKTYIYANSQIIAQHDGYYGDAMYFYLHDRLGSVREVINSTAAVVNTYTYEPFGQSFASEVTQTVVNPWQFTGQYYDSEFGQYFLRARQYDPGIYRFTSRDPYEGSFQEPMELHRYLYCLNDPINRVDPHGKFSYIGIVVSTASRAFMAWNTYEYGAKAYAFAGALMEASDARQALMETATFALDVGIQYFGGKLFDKALSGLNRLSLGLSGNKLHHIFDKAGRNFGLLLSKFNGSKQAAGDAVEAAFRKAVQSGVYAGQNLERGIVIEVAGELVVVRGTIVNGVAEVGTFFVP